MTIKDPQIIAMIGDETVVLTGTPERFLINSTNQELIPIIKGHMSKTVHVPLNPKYSSIGFPTGKNNFVEIAASIVAADWGKARFIEAPDEVWEAIRNPLQYFKGLN